MKRADTYNSMDKQERKEAIRTIFRRLQNKRGGSNDDDLLPSSKLSGKLYQGGGNGRQSSSQGKRDDPSNEVEVIYNKLM